MEESERDSTQDWLLPESSRPPLLGELEARIEEATATARASEAAVTTVGAAAIAAAEQARQAAGIAERAAATALAARRSVSPGGDGEQVAYSAGIDGQDEGLRDFTVRADRIVRRLRDLSPASVGAAPRRSAR